MSLVADRGHLRRWHLSLLLLALLWGLSLPGCFSEHSFPMRESRLAHLPPDANTLPTRAWAARMHAAAASLLPWDKNQALTTDQLSSHGQPIDAWSTFHLRPDQLDSVFTNLDGIEETAQTVSPPTQLEAGHIRRPPWPGFREIEVPVGDGVMLYARLGDPDPAREIPGSYLIITHGLFGTMDGHDVQNAVQALRHFGHHVLALEMRGHGETNCRHPEYAITFGIRETGDLLAAARWLKQTRHATRVGLISFSLTGCESLLSAWLDGKSPVTEFAGIPLLASLPTRGEQPAFNAGMFIVSAPVGMLHVADSFDPRADLFSGPVKASFQAHVAARLAAFHDPPGFTMWQLAQSEFRRSGLDKLYPSFEKARADFARFVDLSADHWHTGAARMENIRIPVLILSSANDPLASAQGVVNLFSLVHNPNIGVILLKHGGHMGFTALSADYYYSLLLNFFNPQTAPAAPQ